MCCWSFAWVKSAGLTLWRYGSQPINQNVWSCQLWCFGAIPRKFVCTCRMTDGAVDFFITNFTHNIQLYFVQSLWNKKNLKRVGCVCWIYIFQFKSGRTVFCHSFSNEFPFEVVCFLLYKIPRKEIQSTWAVCAFSLVQHSRHPVPSAWLLQRGSQVNWMCLQLLATVDKNHFLYGVFSPVRM